MRMGLSFVVTIFTADFAVILCNTPPYSMVREMYGTLGTQTRSTLPE
ncbi:MAG: hypothetical protein ABL959_12660 [Pyrinomonadaceae bacterium]